MNQPSTSDFTRLIGGAVVENRQAQRKPKVVPPTDPHERAVFDAGGKLVRVNLNREKFNRDLEEYAPGCSAPTHVDGTNGGEMPCGGMLTVGGKTEQHFCPACCRDLHGTRSAQSLVGDPVGVPCQEAGNSVNTQQPEYGEQSSQMNQDSTRPQNQSDTVGLDERQSGDKPWGANIDTSASPSGVGGGAAWTQTGSRREAASTDQILDLFINDSFPKDKMPVWPRTGNVRIEKQYGGWALMHYNTPILFRSNEDGAPVFFNTKTYSASTSKLQAYIKRNGGGVEVDEDTIRSEIQRANQIQSDSERTATKKASLGKRSAAQQDMRFDLNARVEVWIYSDEIEGADGYDEIVKGGGSEDQKIQQLKELARGIAVERIGEMQGVEASPQLSDINIDRIDWVALAEGPEARDARENARMDEEDRRPSPFTPAMGESTHNASRSRRRAMAPGELTASVEQFYHRHLAGKIGRIGTELS